jgi:hypothetical protein
LGKGRKEGSEVNLIGVSRIYLTAAILAVALRRSLQWHIVGQTAKYDEKGEEVKQ